MTSQPLKLYLSPLVSVEVGAKWGKYLKFEKASEKPKWMYLSFDNYEVLKSNVEIIDQSHQKNSTFTLVLSDTKSVEANTYRQARTTTLTELYVNDEGQKKTKYFTMNAREWEAFKQRMPRLEDFLGYDEALQVDDNLHFCLIKAPRPHADASAIKEKHLLPRMCKDTFFKALQQHLLHETLHYLKPTWCVGCASKSDAPHRHAVPETSADWELMVDELSDGVIGNTIDLDRAVDLINESQLKWSKDEIPTFDKPTKMALMKEELATDDRMWCEHDDCKQVMSAYRSTFDCVFFPKNKLFK